MGVISLNNTDRLLWLGRYAERVYTTLQMFYDCFDRIIDQGEGEIGEFCRRLDIPAIYPDGETFVEHYCFDAEDPNSIAANLTRAYDNAVTLREEIGTEAVSYIQLAMYELEKTHGNPAPVMGLQRIQDHILSFWGIIDDRIADENARNIVKAGKRIERLDLYARTGMPERDMVREIYRLTDRLKKTKLSYNAAKVLELQEMPEKTGSPDHSRVLWLVDSIFEE